METATIKQAVLELLERGHELQHDWIAGLDEAERAATGAPDQWAARDILSHMAFWQQEQADRVAAARRGDRPRELGDDDTVNREAFEQRRAWPWQRVAEDAERAYANVVAEVRAAGDDLLTDAAQLPWPSERPLWSSVLGNGFDHIFEHVARFYIARGDEVRASAILERMRAQTALADVPGRRAVTLYNVACFYATMGRAEQAAPLLVESFRLDPALIEWSKQDSDLDSLRERADFQALYKS